MNRKAIPKCQYNNDDLFYESPKQYPEADFEIDGIKVHFSYIIDTLPHFDLESDISETGYRSCFPYPEHIDQYGVEGAAREAIKVIRAEYYAELEKQKRKKKCKEQA